MKFVLDCSVTMPWILHNDKTSYSIKILKQLEKNEALVPSLWNLEVTNVLLVAERKKALTKAESDRFLHWLRELPISEEKSTTQMVFDRVIHLAREYSLSSYDAIYLDLSIQQGIPLATLDAQLKKAAQAVGISIFK